MSAGHTPPPAASTATPSREISIRAGIGYGMAILIATYMVTKVATGSATNAMLATSIVAILLLIMFFERYVPYGRAVLTGAVLTVVWYYCYGPTIYWGLTHEPEIGSIERGMDGRIQRAADAMDDLTSKLRSKEKESIQSEVDILYRQMSQELIGVKSPAAISEIRTKYRKMRHKIEEEWEEKRNRTPSPSPTPPPPVAPPQFEQRTAVPLGTDRIEREDVKIPRNTWVPLFTPKGGYEVKISRIEVLVNGSKEAFISNPPCSVQLRVGTQDAVNLPNDFGSACMPFTSKGSGGDLQVWSSRTVWISYSYHPPCGVLSVPRPYPTEEE